MPSKIQRERSKFIESNLKMLSEYDQLIWLKQNCNKRITKIVRSRPKLLQYVLDNVPSNCDNKNDLSYCIYWIITPTLKDNIPIKCYEKTCNKILSFENYYGINVGYAKFCSLKCSAINNETRTKCQNTCVKKYNNKFLMQNKELQEKSKNTKKLLYGNEYWNNREQAIKTENEKLKTNPLYYKEKALKMKQTKLLHYGNENYVNVEKAKETHRKNHNGIDHNFKDPACINKRNNTWLKKYGVKHISQCRDIRLKQQSRYIYNNLKFDSKPELALYIYCLDNNLNFQYQPDIQFDYFFNGKIHKYFPDFVINNEIIEIKGDHFFNKDGTMKNPWNKLENALYEAKHQCMLKNNVKILKTKDYEYYINYIDLKYGKTYLNTFKKDK